MINNPFYRKNSDSKIRELERALLAEYDETALTTLSAAYARLGRVRDLLRLKLLYPGNMIIQNELNRCKKPWADYTQEPKIISLNSHTQNVTCCCYSPDGSRIVSGSDNGDLIILDAATCQIIRRLPAHTDLITCCSYSPDGSQIVSGSDDGNLRILDAATGKIIDLIGHSGMIYCCSYSPDGSQIVSGSYDRTLRIWDAATGQEIRELRREHTRAVTCCSYSPDGSKIVFGSSDRTLRIWDAVNGQTIRVLEGHKSVVTCCSYSPDGSQIVSGSSDRTLRIWDAVNGQTIRVLEGHTGRIACCSYSPDGSQIVSGARHRNESTDYQVEFDIFDYDDPREPWREWRLVIWDLTDQEIIRPRLLEGHWCCVSCCSYSPDGSQIVSGSEDGSLIILRFSSLI